MSDSPVYIQYCHSSDFDAATQVCAYPFWGPSSSFPPPLGVVDALEICVYIVGLWGIGFMIRQARRVAGG
ncbi:MAG: hypothetical protein LBV45_06015 [Xanthomonadaceae bacterium]|jgi:hypothetical protein|nr:hypothetical protein [Xanthomonadaceae bacterium]